jgi:protein-tyrosine phosphatase
VSGWRNSGLDTVVSLLEPDEAGQLGLNEERALALSNGLKFVAFPIPDRSVPASNEAALKLLETVRAELEAGRNVGIHCRQGVGRSGMIAAAALTASGLDLHDAIERVSKARGIAVPETADQLEWLQGLVARYIAASQPA